MKTKPSPTKTAIVHDHFDGSAHCVQCNGECKLTGGDLLATQLVRYTFDFMSIQHRTALPGMLEFVMKEAGIDTAQCLSRACERNTIPLIRRRKQHSAG